ncbi:MarR family winged helix-turn-helix transcriptional regulator [Terrabacter sp. 2TAF16]|uniref:MarR family winged helix-turn-helix transcriptional regulator n=1 Tax=unclassified Terrabacter TaxID=2630222 RepID=UPI003F9E981A
MARGKSVGMPSAPAGADDDLPDHLFRWSDALGRRLSREMRAIAPPDLEAIGGRRARLLQIIPADGMRVTDLASRAGVTKQAIGQLVDTLEELGLVQSSPSESDRRVRWVARTLAGDAVVDQTLALIAEAEDRLRAEVGRARYDAMLVTMRELGRDVTW